MAKWFSLNGKKSAKYFLTASLKGYQVDDDDDEKEDDDDDIDDDEKEEDVLNQLLRPVTIAPPS